MARRLIALGILVALLAPAAAFASLPASCRAERRKPCCPARGSTDSPEAARPSCCDAGTALAPAAPAPAEPPRPDRAAIAPAATVASLVLPPAPVAAPAPPDRSSGSGPPKLYLRTASLLI